jgi:hypothetical protein
MFDYLRVTATMNATIGVKSKGLMRHVAADERPTIKTLKAALAAQGQLANCDAYSALVQAHVFKRYLQSFPEPLMTFQLYDSFVLASCAYF